MCTKTNDFVFLSQPVNTILTAITVNNFFKSPDMLKILDYYKIFIN